MKARIGNVTIICCKSGDAKMNYSFFAIYVGLLIPMLISFSEGFLNLDSLYLSKVLIKPYLIIFPAFLLLILELIRLVLYLIKATYLLIVMNSVIFLKLENFVIIFLISYLLFYYIKFFNYKKLALNKKVAFFYKWYNKKTNPKFNIQKWDKINEEILKNNEGLKNSNFQKMEFNIKAKELFKRKQFPRIITNINIEKLKCHDLYFFSKCGAVILPNNNHLIRINKEKTDRQKLIKVLRKNITTKKTNIDEINGFVNFLFNMLQSALDKKEYNTINSLYLEVLEVIKSIFEDYGIYNQSYSELLTSILEFLAKISNICKQFPFSKKIIKNFCHDLLISAMRNKINSNLQKDLASNCVYFLRKIMIEDKKDYDCNYIINNVYMVLFNMNKNGNIEPIVLDTYIFSILVLFEEVAFDKTKIKTEFEDQDYRIEDLDEYKTYFEIIKVYCIEGESHLPKKNSDKLDFLIELTREKLDFYDKKDKPTLENIIKKLKNMKDKML